MKKIFKISISLLLVIAIVSILAYIKLQPLRAYKNDPHYSGATNFEWIYPKFNSTKKTVLIMADNNMTELFDFLSPYYLFNETGKANVYIAAQNKSPITTQNGPFVLPHFTYNEMDSLKIKPDVIVIPYMHDPESPLKTSWIKKHYSDSVILLSICDGAWTAAASGIYDGVPLTSHATGHDKLKEKFSKPLWVQNIHFTQSGNLYSTAGVSNATNGSLAVIEKLFGHETMVRVSERVNYPASRLKLNHTSKEVDKLAMLTGLRKVLFNRNKKIAVLLQDGVNEIDLAAVFDIYSRTIPASIIGVNADDIPVTTKHGLIVLPKSKLIPGEIDELHVLRPGEDTNIFLAGFSNTEIINYQEAGEYIVDICLNKIRKDYGSSFQNFVSLTLDYN